MCCTNNKRKSSKCRILGRFRKHGLSIHQGLLCPGLDNLFIFCCSYISLKKFLSGVRVYFTVLAFPIFILLALPPDFTHFIFSLHNIVCHNYFFLRDTFLLNLSLI